MDPLVPAGTRPLTPSRAAAAGSAARGGPRLLRRGATALALACVATRAAGQAAGPDGAPRPGRVRGEVFVEGEAERYLRVLQLAGRAPLDPWSLRAPGPRDLDAAAHPRARALDFRRRPGAFDLNAALAVRARF